jgi:hypothetical protein
VPEDRAVLWELPSVFNEGNATLRWKAIERLWAEDGRLVVDGLTVASTRAELDEHIARERTDPAFYVSLKGQPQRSGKLEWGRWEVRRVQAEPELKKLTVRQDGDGRVAEVEATPDTATAAGGAVSRRLREVALENPLATAGLLGGALYLALRLPVGLFYGDLGVTPDEVGVGPEVLIPQSLALIAIFAVLVGSVVGTILLLLPVMKAIVVAGRLRDLGDARAAARIHREIYAAAAGGLLAGAVLAELTSPPLIVALVVLVGVPLVVTPLGAALAAGRGPAAAELRELQDRIYRRGRSFELYRELVVLAAMYAALGLLVVLPLWSLLDAGAVRSGGTAGKRVLPWRALPVELRWKPDAARPPEMSRSCRNLRLLGVGNGQAVVFDTRLDRVFRIPVADASIAVNRDCRGA